jgi:hypothetical protein
VKAKGEREEAIAPAHEKKQRRKNNKPTKKTPKKPSSSSTGLHLLPDGLLHPRRPAVHEPGSVRLGRVVLHVGQVAGALAD